MSVNSSTAVRLQDLARTHLALAGPLVAHPWIVNGAGHLSESAPLSEQMLRHVQPQDLPLLQILMANPAVTATVRQAILDVTAALSETGSTEIREMLRAAAFAENASEELLVRAVDSSALSISEAIAHPAYPRSLYVAIVESVSTGQPLSHVGHPASLLPDAVASLIAEGNPDDLTGVVTALASSSHFDQLDPESQLSLLSFRSDRDGRLILPYVEVPRGRFAHRLASRDVSSQALAKLYLQIMDEPWASRLGSFLDAVVGHYNFEAWNVETEHLDVAITDGVLHASERGLRVLAGLQSDHQSAQENLRTVLAAADGQQLRTLLATALTDGQGSTSRIVRDPGFLALAARRLLDGSMPLRHQEVSLLRAVLFNEGITEEVMDEISQLLTPAIFSRAVGRELTSGVLLHPALPDSAQKRLLWRIASSGTHALRHYEFVMDWITERHLPHDPDLALSIYDSSKFWIRPIDPEDPHAGIESSMQLQLHALSWAKSIEDQDLVPVIEEYRDPSKAAGLLGEVLGDLLQGAAGSSESWTLAARLAGIQPVRG